MANELNRAEDSLEVPAGTEDPTDAGRSEPSASELRVAELESLIAQKDGELAKLKARLAELEQNIASKDSDMAGLRQSRDELESRLTATGHSLAEAVASYKAMVIKANPEVMEELISGDTIEVINESLGQAKTLVSRVRQGLEAENSLARVPVGAPERTLPDLSALSPREKIQYAIGGLSSPKR